MTPPDGQFAFRTAPDPTPAAHHALVQIDTAGICGSDLHAYELIPEYDWVRPLLPVVLGHEITGTVVSFGDPDDPVVSALDVGIGDRVAVRAAVTCGHCTWCQQGAVELCIRRSRLGFERQGGLSTLITTPVNSLQRIEADVPREAAALTEPVTIALRTVRRLPPVLGTDCLVVGMGAIGLLVTELLTALGAHTVRCCGTEADAAKGSFEIVERLGATPFFVDDPSLRRLHQEHDIVVNAAGAPAAIRTALDLVRPLGTVANIALGIGPAEVDIDMLTRRQISLVGVYGNRPEDWHAAVSLINRGTIVGRGIISHWLPLARAEEGFTLLRQGIARKVCITPNTERNSG